MNKVYSFAYVGTAYSAPWKRLWKLKQTGRATPHGTVKTQGEIQ